MARNIEIVGNRVFSEIAEYKRKRIFGTENEYGVIKADSFPREFIENGGYIYPDCCHIEYASPETSNPLEAVIYEKAGELITGHYAKKLYKNNIAISSDPDLMNIPVTYGAHENYFTKANLNDVLKNIIPFLVTRQIFTGSGYLNNGNFEISQRSRFIQMLLSSTTTSNRAILCTKSEPLAQIPDWIRLHLILGDANMCETADFLKLGTTGLVLDSLEDYLLPKIDYNLELAVFDLHKISKITNNWTVIGAKNLEKASDIQRIYLEIAKKAYKNRDEITDEILVRWEDVLNKLDSNQMALFGKIDWITKKALIEAYAYKYNLNMDDYKLRNIDLQYHDLDREKSLFYALQKQGKIERLVNDKLIDNAQKNPPRDTRAYVRGMAIKKFRGKIINFSWDSISLSKSDQNIYPIGNPFNSYKELLEKFEEFYGT